MGRSRIVKLIIRKTKDKWYLGSWRIKSSRIHGPGMGQPTAEALGRWRDKFNQSLLPGGANEHLGPCYWLQCNLEIFDQVTGEVVASYQAPMFEALPNFFGVGTHRVQPADINQF